MHPPRIVSIAAPDGDPTLVVMPAYGEGLTPADVTTVECPRCGEELPAPCTDPSCPQD